MGVWELSNEVAIIPLRFWKVWRVERVSPDLCPFVTEVCTKSESIVWVFEIHIICEVFVDLLLSPCWVINAFFWLDPESNICGRTTILGFLFKFEKSSVVFARMSKDKMLRYAVELEKIRFESRVRLHLFEEFGGGEVLK